MDSLEFARGAAAERKRISSIVRSRAAAGRIAAAVDLALDTDLSVEAAQGLLASGRTISSHALSQEAIDKSWADAIASARCVR